MSTLTPIPDTRDRLGIVSLLASYRRLVWGLIGVLLVGVCACATVAILPLATAPRGEYAETLVIYVATTGGQQAVEWIVRLRIDGELVEARCVSEREALAIKAMMGRRGR